MPTETAALLARALRHPKKNARAAAAAALTGAGFPAFLGKTKASPRASTADGLWKLIRKVDRSKLVDPVAFCEAVGALAMTLEPDAASRQQLATELLNASLRLKVPPREVFEAMPPVPWIDISVNGALPDGIDALEGVERATLRGAGLRSGENMAQLASHSGLFYLQSFVPVSDLRFYDPIAPMIRSLAFGGAVSELADISALAGWRALESVHLDSTGVQDISALSGLSALELVNIGNTQVTDLSPLGGLPALRDLNLARLSIRDFSSLASLPALESLNLSFVPVRDLSVLRGCGRLKRLVLWGAKGLSLAPLADLPLQSLELLYASVEDVAALAGCASLRSIRLVHTTIGDEDRAALQAALPQLRLS